MKTGLKVLGIVFVVVVVAFAALVSLTIGWRPFIGPKARPLTSRSFGQTPERLARGQYLTENVLACFDCHSERDWTKHDVPLIPGTKGGGTANFPLLDLPGKIRPPNISPDKETGAGTWTDDMFARAIREGIGHDGRALFNFMPYERFRHLSDEDLASVVVYVRSLAPVQHVVPKTELIFPVRYLIRSVPEPVTGAVPPPDLSTPVKRGEFLLLAGVCRDCHTPQVKGQALKGLDLAGGFVLRGPWGTVASANLTPDPSGIPYYDETLFIQVIRTGYVKARKLKQIMHWPIFQGMTDEDLKAIFAYLKTVTPIKHRVDNTELPVPCHICGFSHGAGDKN